MDDPPITRPGCCVPKKLDEETIAMLRRDFHKYGPVMKPVPPKRYKFKRTLICSPAEMRRVEEAKRQRLAQEAEEAATGIKRQHRIAYSSHTTNVDPSCDGVLLPVDLSVPLVSDVPAPSWERYVDTYQERRAAAVAALEARAAEVAARPRRPRFFIDPQMKLQILREHEAAEAAAATGTKVQAECVGGAGLKSGTSDSSETHADSNLFVADYSSLEVPSPKLVHEDPNPTTASVTECGGSGVKRPRDYLNPVAADYSSPTAVSLREWIDPLTKLMRYRENAVTQGQSEGQGSVLKRPCSDTNPQAATDPGSEFKVMNYLVAIPSP